MSQAPVEQMCEIGIARINDEESKEVNTRLVSHAVELAYKNIHHRAKAAGKALIGVTQSINTEGFLLPSGISYVIYTITLVGTVVDAALIEAQQRMNQFGITGQVRGRNN